MPKKPKGPGALPGDLVQISDQGHPLHSLIAMVVETHRWGVGVNVPAIQDGAIVGRYERLKPVQFAVVGVAAIMPGEVHKARLAALATQAAVAKEGKHA